MSRPVLSAGLLCVVGVLALLLASLPGSGGELVFPLDDAYIHLALARTLAESGTWGINPGEFANASSSPLWSVLLAVGELVGLGGPAWALAINVLAAGGVLVVADGLLARGGLDERARMLALGALVWVAPLPFLVGLGMEHVVHAALVLALLSAVRGPAPEWAGAVIAALAVSMRLETLLLLGAITIVEPWSRLRGAAVGGATAVGGFALFGLANGGAWVPNGVLKKANFGEVEGVVAAVRECPELVLWVVVLLALAVLDTRPGPRRGAATLALAAAGQLVFGRVGWLYRYEGWLFVLGVVFAAELVSAHPRRRIAWGLVLVLAAVTTHRSALALQAYAPGVRFCADANVSVARWLAAGWPGRVVAVHDLGAAAYYTRGRVVDLGGLGTDVVAAATRRGELTPAFFSRLLDDEQVAIAVTGAQWPQDARPEGLSAAARIFVRHPAPPGEFEVVVWAVDPDLAGALAEGASVLSREGMRVLDGRDLVLDDATLTGAALQHLEGGVVFYTNGTMTTVAPASGMLQLWIDGTAADGRPPRFRVRIPSAEVELAAPAVTERVEVGVVAEGDFVEIIYADDLVDASGGDRNLAIRRGAVRRE